MTGFTPELAETLKLLVTRIRLDIRTGKLPPEWGGPVLERAIKLVEEHAK